MQMRIPLLQTKQDGGKSGMVWWTFPTQVWHIMRPDGITCRENGMVDFGYCGAVQNEFGIWYVENGRVDMAYDGRAYGYYFSGGKAQ